MARHVKKEEEAEINMTPMLDMTFIMLIFFIVTTSFVKEAGVTVQEPTAFTAASVPHGNILIGVTNTGQIWMQKHQIQLAAVRGMVEQARSETPESSVIIIADKNATTGLVIQVMDQVRLAGVSHVSLAAERSSD